MNFMPRTFLILLSILILLAPAAARAHEIRPAYLEMTETSNRQVRILWKQPIMGEVALRLTPQLSSGWLDPTKSTSSSTEAYLIREWIIVDPTTPLNGQTVTIEGLSSTMTDVFLRVTFADGTSLTQVIRPLEPSFTLMRTANATFDRLGYFRLGVEHIFFGLDHLLFVLGLLIIVRGTAALFKTITAFTVAHTITLGLATFGVIRVPTAPVEAVIALSIIFLALEIIKQQRGIATLTSRAPWIVAFAFGLLHGFGFAGALSQIGIPHGDIATALFLFNCGVEVGQLIFVGICMLLIRLLRSFGFRFSTPVQRLTPYAIGSVASFWFLQRCALIFA